MLKNHIQQVIIDQQAFLKKSSRGIIKRNIDIQSFLKGDEIIVISGIRRCGKSTLLKNLSKYTCYKTVYINFDDIRFIDLCVQDYIKIEEIILELLDTEQICFLLDEIQNVPHWARWINNLYEKQYKVFVTGSNADLLSGEISTYLTGRNKQINLFPFSFFEFLIMKDSLPESKKLSTLQKTQIFNLWKEYFVLGGFPNVIKNKDINLSAQYFDDIVHKHIIHRYKIREIKEFKNMIVFLFSNLGKNYSYSTLKKITEIKSLSTIKNYLDHLENSFLVYILSRFDYSISKQKLSSHKIYASDNIFLKSIAFNFSKNSGRRLENIVLIHLKRNYKEVFYHKNKHECDFIVKEGSKIIMAIQVTQFFDDPKQTNYEREINGLLEAMDMFDVKIGIILTENDSNILTINNKQIQILPVWEWMLNKVRQSKSYFS